ncbi:MAG: hypothetical protein ABI353_13550 [Isosphaeraceae bacterium]
MTHQSEHFPTFPKIYRTFSKAYRVITAPIRSRVIPCLIRLERTLLRLALYLFLFASGLCYLVGRFLTFTRGNDARVSLNIYGPGSYESSSSSPGTWVLDSLFYLLSCIVLPPEALLIVVLCLVGLAVSAHRPTLEVLEPSPKPNPALMPTPPEPPPAPPTPQRHPLDPSPDDPPPIDYPWLHRRPK